MILALSRFKVWMQHILRVGAQDLLLLFTNIWQSILLNKKYSTSSIKSENNNYTEYLFMLLTKV